MSEDNREHENSVTSTRREIRKLLREWGVVHATIEMEGADEKACRHEIGH
ncbi:hypothetical protein KGY47_02660 [Candidatus Bipolaricaulota bacterium]|nr:hypothetical protein [Candidatus Bipolaricaulota bacterium]MBS3814359.1 hypothetical protein [Candidatus Bipolaricaulota bacterium]MBS3825068.1 hypothetical protein [Candidatus Bipolaricaulota bacterium]